MRALPPVQPCVLLSTARCCGLLCHEYYFLCTCPPTVLQVGVAGPSGSGKTAFSEKVKTLMPGEWACGWVHGRVRIAWVSREREEGVCRWGGMGWGRVACGGCRAARGE